ncbi:MAG: hypothetical protein M1132_00890 [Chloroflexi bacterium]|nr:hypothetical protein [Chloroflexota bacterium]
MERRQELLQEQDLSPDIEQLKSRLRLKGYRAPEVHLVMPEMRTANYCATVALDDLEDRMES